jgi:major capsid protein gp7
VATLTQTMLSMMDGFKRTDANGGLVPIIEMLNDTSQDILTDFVMRECNSGTKHTHNIRSGLGSVSWGAHYEGIPQSKSSVQQVDDTTGFVEALCSVDTRVLDLYGSNAAAIRAQESEAEIETMAQELVTALFYHNPASNVRHPKGLGARFGTLATSGAGNQILDAGGTGSDNMSIWFATWGGQGLTALYPQGTTAGITQEDKGEQRKTDSSGNPYFVKEELVRAYMGFAVGDYRRISRIANIDASDLQAGTVDLYKYMRKAYYRLHNRRMNKVRMGGEGEPQHTVIYANRDALEALDGLAVNAGSSDNFTRLRPMEIEGKEVLGYRGIPIRETDALLNTEARIV